MIKKTVTKEKIIERYAMVNDFNLKYSLKLPPEIELLLYCDRTQIDTQSAKKIQNCIQQDIDWSYLIKTAFKHQVIPLVYQSLNATCPESVPANILKKLQDLYRQNSLRGLFLTQELIRLLKIFRNENLPIIPYKGSILAVSCYGNLSLRSFYDIDFLVHPRDFQKASQVLIDQGYQRGLALDWEQGFFQQKSKLQVDLHQALTPDYFPFAVDFDQLWERLETLSISQTKIISFKPEDLIIILSVQVAKDFWAIQAQLSKICDIAELLRSHPQLNWKEVIQSATQLGTVRILFFGLWLASQLCGVNLPREISTKIKADRTVHNLGYQAIMQLFFIESYDNLSSIQQAISRASFHLKIRERFRERLPYLSYIMRKSLFNS